MPGTLASLLIKLGLDATGVEQGVAKANASIGGLSTGAGTAMRVAGSLIGGGLAFAAKSALEMEDRAARFQADTGASAAEARHFADTVNAAAASSLLSMDDIAASATRIRTDLGLTGDAADASLGLFLRYERATNQGADAVLAYDDILDAWNLTASDTTAIMDTLIAGQQTYGGSIAESQDLLAKLAPVLQGANMSWQQGTELINLFNAAGVDATAGITGMTKALGKVESPAELQALLVDIANTVDPFERAQKAIDAFGAKAGPKLAQALQASGGDLSRFGFEMDEVRGRTEEAAQALDDTLTSKVKLGLNQALSLLRGFGMEVGPILTGAVSAISFGKALGLGKLFSKVNLRPLATRFAGAFTSVVGSVMESAAAKLAGSSRLGGAWVSAGRLMGGKFGTAFKAVALVALLALIKEMWDQFQVIAAQTRTAAAANDTAMDSFLAGAPTRADVEAKLAALKAIPGELTGVQQGIMALGSTGLGSSFLTGVGLANPYENLTGQIDALETYLKTAAPDQLASGVDAVSVAVDGAMADGTAQVAENLDKYVTAWEDGTKALDLGDLRVAVLDADTGIWTLGQDFEDAAGDVQASVLDWVDSMNSAIATGGPAVARTIADVRADIVAGFDAAAQAAGQGWSDIHQALDNPPKLMSRKKRLQKMADDISQIWKNLHAAIRKDDPVNTAYWASQLTRAQGAYTTATGSMTLTSDQLVTQLTQAGVDIRGSFLDNGTAAQTMATTVNTAASTVTLQPAIDAIDAAETAVTGLPVTVNEQMVAMHNAIERAESPTSAAVNGVVSQFSPLANLNGWSWGQHLVQTFVGGIQDKYDLAFQTAQTLARTVSTPIRFSHPPRVGPLSDIRSWGPHMVVEWTRPIGRHLGDVERTAGRLAAAMTPRPAMPAWAGASANGQASRWSAPGAVGLLGRSGDVVHVHVGTLIANDAGLDELEARMARRRRRRRRGGERLVGSY
jgi:hypothetical protein